MARLIDPHALFGKVPPVAERCQVLVIGAGRSGLEAAIAAAGGGERVVLVDEHPLDPGLIGLDVPLHFGGRSDGSERNRNAATEALIASEPLIAVAFEAGVDLRLGVTAWGGFVNGATVHSLPENMVGLADEDHSWLIGFDRLVVAAGRRDLGFAFPGWELPGVMGAAALHTLLRRYGGISGKRLLILGGGKIGLEAALQAREAGLEIAGVVEVLEMAPDAVASLQAAGIPLFGSSMIAAALGDAEVEGARIVRIGGDGQPIAGSAQEVACDTIVLALGAVPNIELLDQMQCRLTYRPELGGYVPERDGEGRTSLDFVTVRGDCAGIPQSAGGDIARRLAAWTYAGIAVAGLDVVACQCEEVTRADILEVRPPRYLGCDARKSAARNIDTLIVDGPLNQDQVKRLTRAGMGVCQGRRCREQVSALLALAERKPLELIPLAGYRAPLRPLPLKLLQEQAEQPGMRTLWDVWFGIPGQFSPYWDIE